MLKLRKPFSQKIRLHIRQDMLQRLWEKYVPASSPEYEQIQLIYLDWAHGQERRQPQQIRILVSLVMKSRMMQAMPEQYPSALAFGLRRMEHSLQRMEKYCLIQLRSSNFTAFRILDRYVEVLKREKLNGRYYREWQKEQEMIEKLWQGYRLLFLFSVRIREILEGGSGQMIKALEQELLVSLSKAEYQVLSEKSLWQKRAELITYLKTCSETQYRQIVKRLGRETDLITYLKTHNETLHRQIVEELKSVTELYRAPLKLGIQQTVGMKKGERKEKIAMAQILKTAPGQPAGEKLAEVAELFDQKHLWMFYHKVLKEELVNRQPVIWKKDRKEMLSYLKQANTEQLQELWGQLDAVYSEKTAQLREEYQQNLILHFREQAALVTGEESFEKIVSVMDNVQSDTQLFQSVEQMKEIWREKIRQREADAIEKYGELYREALAHRVSGDRQRKTGQFMEEIFRNRLRKNSDKETWMRMTDEEIQNICEWSRVLSESVERDGRSNAFHESFAEKTFIGVDKLDTSNAFRESFTEQPFIGVDELDTSNAFHESFTEQTIEKEKLKALVRQINYRIEEKSISEETVPLIFREEQVEKEKIESLFTYMHKLKMEQRAEFVRQLADAVLIWRQMEAFRQVFEKVRTDSFVTKRQGEIPGITEQQEREKGQEELSFSQSVYQEDMQAQMIHRQIEAAKDKNSPQRLVAQMNQRLEFWQKTEGNLQEENYESLQKAVSIEPGQAGQIAVAYPGLVYHIREYERHRKTVSQQLQKLAQTYVHQIYGSTGNTGSIESIGSTGNTGSIGSIGSTGNTRNIGSTGNTGSIRSTGNTGSIESIGSTGNIRSIRRAGNTGSFESESDDGSPQLSLVGSVQQLYDADGRKLHYSSHKDYGSDKKQELFQMQVREETMQIKAVQEQLDRKLREVEKELKKTENFSVTKKEDADTMAELVKKQLYEELHVEKLRRGLV